jgi:hypothetical protein
MLRPEMGCRKSGAIMTLKKRGGWGVPPTVQMMRSGSVDPGEFVVTRKLSVTAPVVATGTLVKEDVTPLMTPPRLTATVAAGETLAEHVVARVVASKGASVNDALNGEPQVVALDQIICLTRTLTFVVAPKRTMGTRALALTLLMALTLVLKPYIATLAGCGSVRVSEAEFCVRVHAKERLTAELGGAKMATAENVTMPFEAVALTTPPTEAWLKGAPVLSRALDSLTVQRVLESDAMRPPVPE